MKSKILLMLTIFITTTAFLLDGQVKNHPRIKQSDSMAQAENRKYAKLCHFTKMLLLKKIPTHEDFDSLLVLTRITAEVCNHDGTANKLFNFWVHSGYADSKMLEFFLELSNVSIRNVEFSESLYQYIIIITLMHPELILSSWNSLGIRMKMTFSDCLNKKLQVYSYWNSLSSDEKSGQMINFWGDITVGLPLADLPKEESTTFLDSVANGNEIILKDLQEKLLEADKR
jgi:hypothetical protein